MVNLKLALGQLVRDPIYHEIVPEFQTLAYFKTTVHLRNAFQVRFILATVISFGIRILLLNLLSYT